MLVILQFLIDAVVYLAVLTLVAIGLGLACVVFLWWTGNLDILAAFPQRMVAGIDQFVLLTIPLSRQELAHVVCETCRQNNLSDAYIRLVVTRGVGDLGLAPWLCPNRRRAA